MRFLALIVLAGCPGPKAPAAEPQTAECPATAPADRSSCARLLVKCNYPGEARCPFAHCADVAGELVWMTSYDHCAIVCPTAKPVAGTACGPVTSQACAYKGGDKCGFRLHCTAKGWAEEEVTLCDGM